MLGFSDIPVAPPPDALSYHGCIEVKYVTDYLENYMDKHVYNDSTLRSRVCGSHHVEEVEKSAEFWIVTASELRSFQVQEFRSLKVVIAAV